MAYHDNFKTGFAVPLHLIVHLGYQRASGIKHLQIAPLGIQAHCLTDTMGAEYGGGAIRNLIQLFNEYGAFLFQPFHHEAVMHHFMAHINRRPETFQRPINNFYCTIDTGTKPPGTGKYDFHIVYSTLRISTSNNES